ncbi:DUF3180 domain-containing protein [Bifidobacterium cuniculi]|uniref:Permease n=1 Tax=Bifidobacterium cuniculi TaxID=1688 RepID=A0A087AKL2_9BIFI|nr:DUF3180 domain-containing protein [Bifidobacterium cuniculi]KFI59312.1 permease [Bifidobacterium cuniculi]
MAHRTRPWVYVVTCVVGAVLGGLLGYVAQRRNIGFLGTSWLVSALMVAVGVVVTVLAWQVHRWATADARKKLELRTVTPERALQTLVYAKALAVAGAFLLGWYGGQIVTLMPRFEASYYRGVIVECAIAAVASLIDLVLGIVSEGLCKLPPTDGPEHPTATQRKQQGLA